MENCSFHHGKVIDNLIQWQLTGLSTALITLVAVDGRSPYPIGTQMGVAWHRGNTTGNVFYCGYLTSGCAEKAIVQQALAAIKMQKRSVHRYGKGSPYFDIVLPCGSGIDVLIDPLIPLPILEQLSESIGHRSPVWLCSPMSSPHSNRLMYEPSLPNSHDATFYRYYPPTPKLIIAGQGPIVAALSHFALAADFAVDAYFNDPQSAPQQTNALFSASPLQCLTPQKFSDTDAHTAFISLLHEHDKESQFLVPALKSNLFYVGALGSQTTHSTRCDLLRAMNIEEVSIEKIRGPIGFALKAKTPEEIALSILSEVIAIKNNALNPSTQEHKKTSMELSAL